MEEEAGTVEKEEAPVAENGGGAEKNEEEEREEVRKGRAKVGDSKNLKRPGGAKTCSCKGWVGPPAERVASTDLIEAEGLYWIPRGQPTGGLETRGNPRVPETRGRKWEQGAETDSGASGCSVGM